MRKSSKLIAGLGVVAGLGVALAPLGAFADVTTPTRTDVIRFTNSASCTVNTVNLDNTTVDLYNYYDGTVTPGNEATLQIVDGTEETNPGTTTEQKFTIACNSASGYKVVANATNPSGVDVGSNTDQTILAGTAISGNTSFWAAQISVTGNLTSTNSNNWFAIASSDQKVASNSAGSGASGDSFSVSYKVGAAKALKAGKYEGKVVYTVVEGAN